jgi:hypothetical protein
MYAIALTHLDANHNSREQSQYTDVDPIQLHHGAMENEHHEQQRPVRDLYAISGHYLLQQ